jgi:hypothetical protein
MGSTKRTRDNRRQPWSGAPDCPVCHRIVSGAPPDSVRCTRGLHSELLTFGKIQRCSAIIHRTVRCTPDSVRCTRGLHSELLTFGKIQSCSAIIHRTVRCTPDRVRCSKEERLWNSPASGIRSAIIHRTYPVYTGLSGEPAEQRLPRANGHLHKH